MFGINVHYSLVFYIIPTLSLLESFIFEVIKKDNHLDMKKILIFAILASFMVACGGSTEGTDDAKKTTASAPAPKPAADAPDGAKIYKTNCIACHGLYGDMGASGAFNLQTSVLTLEERIDVITNGRNLMAPWGSILKEDQIKAVAEYTFTLKKDE